MARSSSPPSPDSGALFSDAPPPDSVRPPQPIKGRGTTVSPAPRFDALSRVAEDDGWWREADGAPATQVFVDSAKSVLTHNDSPDLPFSLSLNPYRGCEHGCIYCYARPSHAFLGLSPGVDFETKIFHKPDAARLLRRELSQAGYACTPIALGTNTDAYQPLERKLRLTRGVLEVLHELKHPVTLITKSALVLRDVDLLAAMARQGLAQVMVSLTTLDVELARRLEPRAAAPHSRLEAMRGLSAAGIPVGVMFSPVIPGLNDHELEKCLAAAHDAGARAASYTVLRLPHEVHALFDQWLAWHAPDKASRIMAILYDMRGGKGNDPRFGSRMRGLGHFADLLAQRFRLAARRIGFTGLPELDCSQFRAPQKKIVDAPLASNQGQLF